MSTTFAERARRLRRRDDEQNETTPPTAAAPNAENEITRSTGIPRTVPDARTYVQGPDEIRKNPAAAPFDTIARRERWDMIATVDYVRRLSPEKLAVYRAAIVFDAEALRQADVAKEDDE